MSDTAIAATVAALFLVIYAALVITAVVQVLRSTAIAQTSKIAWIVGIVIFPLIGSVAWFLLGDKTTRVENAIGTARR